MVSYHNHHLSCSPITHTLSSASRGVVQTLLAVVILGEILTVYRTISIVITIAGTILYTWIRSIERNKKESKASKSASLSYKIPHPSGTDMGKMGEVYPQSDDIIEDTIPLANKSIHGQNLRPYKLPANTMVMV